MDRRTPFVGQFLVNGTKSEVSVDDDSISWTPIKVSSTTPFGSLDHGTSLDSNVGVSLGSIGSSKKTRQDNGIKRIEFDQVIGFRRGHHNQKQQQQQRPSSLPATATSQGCQLYKTLSIDTKRHNRIKLYYSKQSANKSTVSVAQFQLTNQQLEQFQSQLQLQRQQIESRPSATATATTPTQQQATTTTTPLDYLARRIEESLEPKRQTRPQRLLIFVNPFCGKGKALHLYKSQVRRLLELAGVETKLVVTNYANHARDTIEDPLFNVEYFDGVVCVGGDGMFAELMNGLLFRYNRDKISNAQRLRLARIAAGVNGTVATDADDTTVTNGSSSSDSGVAAGGLSGGELSENEDLDQQQQQKQPNGITTQARVKVVATKAQVATSGGGGRGNNSSSSDDDGDGDGIGSNKQRQRHQKPSATSIAAAAEVTNNILNVNQDVSFSENNTVSEQRLIELRSALGGIGQQFESPPVPVGVIGAGSTDANSFGLIGTNDVITATLNIILGNQIKIDVCSVHTLQEDRVLRFVSTFVAYGYFGDVIRESEKLRWLGPSRYDVTGVNNLIKNRTYKGRVEILSSSLDGTPNNNLERCHSKCENCSVSGSASNKQQQKKEPEFRIIEIQGSFIGVNAAITACRCPKTKKGFSPSNHLANGCADLILVRPCTRMQYIHYLLRTGWSKKSAFDLKYVEAYRCRQFEFVALSPKSLPPVSSIGAITSTVTTTSTAARVTNNTDSTTANGSVIINSSLGPSSWILSSASSVDRNSNNPKSLNSQQLERLKSSIGSTFSSWNVDGEILNEQSIRVKVNNQLMRVFGTGEPTSR